MSRPLKLCFISQEYPPYTAWGGIGTYYKQLTERLRIEGHKITIITRYNKNIRPIDKSNNIDILFVGLPVWVKYFIGRTFDKIINSVTVYIVLRKIDKKYRYDIIETPEVNLEAFALILDNRFKDRVVIQCHGSNQFGVIPDGKFRMVHIIDLKMSYYIEKYILRRASRILVPSKSGMSVLKRIGINKKKISLMYHGIDTELFYKFEPSDIASNGNIKVGFVGRLENRKGIQFIWKLLDYFETDTPIEFHFFGSVHKSAKSDVDHYLEKYSKHVYYHRPLQHDDMPKVYNSIHILIAPSKFEQFGLVYAEAMACELLVFAGKEGGGQEIINSNSDGFLLDPEKDEGVVFDHLIEYVHDPQKYNKLKINARKKIKENFSLKQLISNKLKYYNKIRV
jgi:glycosyltransferase involved in cell wall biosynthesis